MAITKLFLSQVQLFMNWSGYGTCEEVVKVRAERGWRLYGGRGLSVISISGKYATLKRLKNMPVSPQFSEFAEYSDYLQDPPQTSA